MARLIAMFLLLAGIVEWVLAIAATVPEATAHVVDLEAVPLQMGPDVAWQYSLLATISWGFAGMLWRKASIDIL